jgi:hypothetical protein
MPEVHLLARVKDRSGVEWSTSRCSAPATVVWHKRRLMRPNEDSEIGSWTEEDYRIASRRHGLTFRAARAGVIQVCRHVRSDNEVGREPGCDWHIMNDTRPLVPCTPDPDLVLVLE